MHLSRSLGSLVLAVGATAVAANLSADSNVRAALDRISAASMRGHVSFLASDLLEGRGTPSRGLDVAAEYIAAQFRRAGLEPAGDDGYFQTAKYFTFDVDNKGVKLELISGEKRIPVPPDQVTGAFVTAPLSLSDVPVLKVGAADLSRVQKWTHDDVKGKAVAFKLGTGMDRQAYRAYSTVRRLHPALLIIAGSGNGPRPRSQLISADQRDSETPSIHVGEGDFASALSDTAEGLKINVSIGAPKETAVSLRNIVGLVRGSDPVLRDSYVLVTGHYDHMGMKPSGDGDRIYNGANDDASGTVSMMEIAAALAGMSPAPKRSVLFIALFGEELGLLGSQYYGRHPLVPLARTVADINLEHMGRTDAPEGTLLSSATFTGYDFSEVPSLFQKAGEQVGVKVYKDDKRSDPFFARSDNQALADLGIPAHTICVAFEFPDYHGVGDEWQKIDYDNMARVDRMVALGVIMLADQDAPPKWNTSDTKTKRYVDAWQALHAEGTH